MTLYEEYLETFGKRWIEHVVAKAICDVLLGRTDKWSYDYKEVNNDGD